MAEQQYMTRATVTLETDVFVLANSEEEAKAKLRRGEWEDWDEEGADCMSVEPNLSGIHLDPAFVEQEKRNGQST